MRLTGVQVLKISSLLFNSDMQNFAGEVLGDSRSQKYPDEGLHNVLMMRTLFFRYPSFLIASARISSGISSMAYRNAVRGIIFRFFIT